MRRFGEVLRVAAGLASIGFLANAVRASEPLPPVRYVASAGCPGPEEFSRELRQHLRRIPDGGLTIEVVAMQLDGGAAARVSFVRSGVQSLRELSGRDCNEVVAAAALVAAVALDTLADEQPSTPAPSSPPPAPFLPVRDHGAASTLPAASDVDGFVWELGAGAVVQAALAPRPMLGGGAFVGLGEARGAWDVRLHASYARSGVIDRGEQAAEFELLAGRLEACALTIVDAPSLVLKPCAAVEVGRAKSEGIDTPSYRATPQATEWGAAGPLLRAESAFDPVRLGVFAGPWVPFAGTRTFVFEDAEGNTTFHDVPLVGWLLGANVTLSLK